MYSPGTLCDKMPVRRLESVSFFNADRYEGHTPSLLTVVPAPEPLHRALPWYEAFCSSRSSPPCCSPHTLVAKALTGRSQFSPLKWLLPYATGSVQAIQMTNATHPTMPAPSSPRIHRALRLWREGLALSPDHQELRREAEKYRELAFWTGIPVENIKNTINDTSASSSGCGNNTSRCSGSAVVGRGQGKSGHDRTPPLFSALPLPPTSPPQPLLAKTGKEASLFHDSVDSAVPAAAAAATAVHFFDNAGGQAEFASLEEEEAPDNLDVEFMAGDGEWVCSTRFPPLSASECAAIVDEAEAKAASAAAAAGRTGAGSSGWGTARHYAVPTTDMAIRELPRALAWFNTAMRTRIGPLVAAAAALGEGVFSPRRRPRRRRRRMSGSLECSLPSETYAQRLSTATATAQKEEEEEEDQEENETSASDILRRIRVHDAFVVRYDAAAQRSLPLHTDQGELSLTISLNSADEYEGGGTWFEGLGRAVRPDEAGHVVVFPGGSTVHGGREVTNGVRYILAVFLYCHGAEEEEDEEEEDEEEGSGS